MFVFSFKVLPESSYLISYCLLCFVDSESSSSSESESDGVKASSPINASKVCADLIWW